MSATATTDDEPRSAWVRLGIGVAIGTIGSVGLWSGVVALPVVQSEFGALRGGASLPYTMTMLGFAFGGVAIGRLADRVGIAIPLMIGAALLTLGYTISAFTTTLWQFAIVQGLLIGAGSAASFAPLMAEVSHWFTKRRGIAVAIAASGNYLAGTIWPPIVQHLIANGGWRQTHLIIAGVCLVALPPLLYLFTRGAPKRLAQSTAARGEGIVARLGLTPAVLQTLLIIAGASCCVAMAMPQVHLVAYCGDLGYGPARGAEMLSLMLGLGVVSRIGSGFIADRIGGLATLALGSAMQGFALLLYMAFNSLPSLYVISGLFGLFQGGIVPCYAIVIRDFFPAKEAGTRIGATVMATIFGMALGGWMSGAIFDMTGSYQAAFANGVAWNLLHLGICAFLMLRVGGRLRAA